MFPLSFPLRVLAEANAEEAVLDPFCGRGTTLYAGRLLGLPSFGIDANPVAVALARAKLATATPAAVEHRCRELLGHGYSPAEIPAGEFWRNCYAPGTLADVCSLREQLRVADEDHVTVLLRALLLGVLHGPAQRHRPSYLSNQMPRTYSSKPRYAVKYWRSKGLRPVEVDVAELVARRAAYTLKELPSGVRGEVLQGSSVFEISRLVDRFSWVITSPPYFGMRTYLSDQWLRAWFLGAEPEVDYRTDGQLMQSSEDVFVTELSRVWEAAAGRCRTGARLVVRFGALPSRAKDPTGLLQRSLERARVNWVIDAVLPAGVPPVGRRQADHMRGRPGEYVEEVDLYATLGK
jgi:hypothetical protein